MTTEHFIPGKDASLEASIDAMHARLAQLGFHVEERSWLNPVEGIWSVHLVERDCPLLFTNGKGASKLAALASGLGEFFERLGTRYFWTHYYLGAQIANGPHVHSPDERWFPVTGARWPKELLTPELQRFYNPEKGVEAERLVDLNSGNAGRGICALPYERLSDGAAVWFPVNIIGNLYVSNGMSAGNTPQEARAQALAEIFERHIKFRVIAEGLCLPDVPEEVIARWPRIEAGIRALREAGFGILVKDASLGGEYPVMCVTLVNPADQGIFASFGAHPRSEIALERALTELLQGRALDALGGFPAPSAELEEVAQPQNLESHFVDSTGLVHWNFLRDAPDFPFADWNFSSTTDEDYQWLVDRIHADGREIYVKEFTRLGFYACRVLVPGMSEIYPVDDLEWENNSLGNALREPILRLMELDDEQCALLHDALSELDDVRPVAPLIGLAPDAGSLWRELRIGELKTLLALAVGDDESVREGCTWLRHFGQIAPERAKVYRCVEALLELEDREPFAQALEQLFGHATLELAQAMLDGEMRFFGMGSPGPDLAGCELHQRLLAAYAKVQSASLNR